MSSKVAYVIQEAHPDYKRPSVSTYFGTIDESEMKAFFIEQVTDFIFHICYDANVKSSNDIKKIWTNFYQEYYMDNAPWSANIFINGEWMHSTPSNEEIYECYIKMKADYEKEPDEEEDDNNVIDSADNSIAKLYDEIE